MTESKIQTESQTPKFTDAQIQAIYTGNKDILVSAGAGSGKTTVLTKRLIERIKSGDSVTDFLVVTFMSSAAADIKRKLYEALLKENAENPENRHIYRETLLVSEANISTISSFCLATVKENFALAGVSPRVRVADDTESSLLLHRAAEAVVTAGYEEGSEQFLVLADNFSSDKSDDGLIDEMIKLYLSLRVTLGWKDMLHTCAENLRADADVIRTRGFFASNDGSETRERLKTLYDEILTSAYDMFSFAASVATDDKYLAPLQDMVKVCENVRASLESDYVNFCSAAYESTLTISLASKGCEKEYREIIKAQKEKIVEALRDLYDRYCRGSESFIADSYLRSADIVNEISRFLVELDKEYELAKMESGMLDYTDFEAKTLELLETIDENGNSIPTELCLKKQSEFKEILIDEYQDVNPMQDRIFALLAGKSHRFMVGDVKQSIYRFRNAYPDIFLGYKESFADISLETAKNARIFLRENFRCASPVINYVNRIFENVTAGTPFAREYEGESLVHASLRPERKTPVVVAIAKKEPKLAKEARRAEAEYIAREIVRLVNEETTDEGKPIKYSDCAVMLSVMKGKSIEYEKAFQKYGIPYKKEKSQNFLENPDIRLAISALRAIDDPNDDISLCALLRSPICNFTSEDLYKICCRSSGVSFWNALLKCAFPSQKYIKNKKYRFKTHLGAPSLSAVCRAFAKRLSSWREESTGVPCCDFLKSFFVSSGLLRISVSSGTKASLLLLYDYSSRFETARNYGLSGFLDYIAELSSSGKIISDVARSGEDDAVSFITVHKSKGLEFNVCFVASADSGFKGMSSGSGINMTRRKGIYFQLRDKANLTTYDPMCNILAMDRERESIVGEELRKLYVALTRAKERLYVTGCMPHNWEEKRYTVSSAKCWMDLAVYVHNLGESTCFDLIHIDETDGEAGYIPLESKKIYIPTEKMLDIVNFKYPYSKSVSTAAKISVSELREGLLEDDEYNRTHLSVPASRVALRPAFASQRKADAGEIGTANHLFMQFCNFKNAEQDISAEANRLLQNRMITEEQLKMLDFPALEKFFASELYARIKASDSVYREKRFSVRDILSENGEPILVQGVIDCFFKNPDGTYTVVDYKTDRVKTFGELVARHRIQLSCYKRAVEGMTGCKVSETLLYSFALGGEVKAL